MEMGPGAGHPTLAGVLKLKLTRASDGLLSWKAHLVRFDAEEGTLSMCPLSSCERLVGDLIRTYDIQEMHNARRWASASPRGSPGFDIVWRSGLVMALLAPGEGDCDAWVASLNDAVVKAPSQGETSKRGDRQEACPGGRATSTHELRKSPCDMVPPVLVSSDPESSGTTALLRETMDVWRDLESEARQYADSDARMLDVQSRSSGGPPVPRHLAEADESHQELAAPRIDCGCASSVAGEVSPKSQQSIVSGCVHSVARTESPVSHQPCMSPPVIVDHMRRSHRQTRSGLTDSDTGLGWRSRTTAASCDGSLTPENADGPTSIRVSANGDSRPPMESYQEGSPLEATVVSRAEGLVSTVDRPGLTRFEQQNQPPLPTVHDAHITENVQRSHPLPRGLQGSPLSLGAGHMGDHLATDESESGDLLSRCSLIHKAPSPGLVISSESDFRLLVSSGGGGELHLDGPAAADARCGVRESTPRPPSIATMKSEHRGSPITDETAVIVGGGMPGSATGSTDATGQHSRRGPACMHVPTSVLDHDFGSSACSVTKGRSRDFTIEGPPLDSSNVQASTVWALQRVTDLEAEFKLCAERLRRGIQAAGSRDVKESSLDTVLRRIEMIYDGLSGSLARETSPHIPETDVYGQDVVTAAAHQHVVLEMRQAFEAEKRDLLFEVQKVHQAELWKLRSSCEHRQLLELAKEKSFHDSREKEISADLQNLSNLHRQRTSHLESMIKEECLKLTECRRELAACQTTQCMDRNEIKQLQESLDRQRVDFEQQMRETDVLLQSALARERKAVQRLQGLEEVLKEANDACRMEKSQKMELRRQVEALTSSRDLIQDKFQKVLHHNETLQRELDICKQEVQLLEHENKRLERDKSMALLRVAKLDRVIYGASRRVRSTSPKGLHTSSTF
jgi:hypothetical protein